MEVFVHQLREPLLPNPSKETELTQAITRGEAIRDVQPLLSRNENERTAKEIVFFYVTNLVGTHLQC